MPAEEAGWKPALPGLFKEKEVPTHRFTWAYYLGGLTLIALKLQFITGILLLLYYKPTTIEAYQSVQFITRTVPGGDLIRSVHAWSANAVVFMVFVHFASVFVLRAYRRPREWTWVSGAVSMLLLLALSFSGYLLPWNTLSVYATKVGTEIMQASTLFLPGMLAGIGGSMASLLLGGATVGQETLTRFFALHVAILPAILVGIVLVHLLLIQLHGMSVPLSETKTYTERGRPAEKFIPTFVVKDFAMWILFAAAITILAKILPYEYFLPYTLARAYDPLLPAPDGIRPEWYFFFVYYPLEIFPRAVVIIGTIVLTLAFIFAPWLLNRVPALWGKQSDESPVPTYIALAAIIIIITLTIFGAPIVTAVRGGH
jgi:quinol-cytochrome oxidoreductase complex cytochrome b subunit